MRTKCDSGTEGSEVMDGHRFVGATEFPPETGSRFGFGVADPPGAASDLLARGTKPDTESEQASRADR